MPNFKFFNNLVAEIQTKHSNYELEQCEELAIVSIFDKWKSVEGNTTKNISLYLYMTRLYKVFPHLKALAEKSTMWASKTVKQEISWIIKTRSWTRLVNKTNNTI